MGIEDMSGGEVTVSKIKNFLGKDAMHMVVFSLEGTPSLTIMDVNWAAF
jgi:hypothetical protein